MSIISFYKLHTLLRDFHAKSFHPNTSQSCSYFCKNDKPLQKNHLRAEKNMQHRDSAAGSSHGEQYKMRRATSSLSTLHLPKSHSHIASQLNQPSASQQPPSTPPSQFSQNRLNPLSPHPILTNNPIASPIRP